MTTHRFQPGDKIKAGPFTADLGLTPGNVYTVHHVDDFGLVQPDGVRHHHFHPSHFKLVERAIAEPAETYCLKDCEGDWHVSTESAEDGFRMISMITPYGPSVLTRSVERLVDTYGIDAEPTGLMRRLAALMAEPPVWADDPAPLAVGDWVKVLARVEQVYDNGSVRWRTFLSDGSPNPSGYAIASAITRTDEVPEWAQEPERPEEPTADYAIARDGFRTYVRLPADQIPAFATGKPWALVGVADAYFAWDEIDAPKVVEVTA